MTSNTKVLIKLFYLNKNCNSNFFVTRCWQFREYSIYICSRINTHRYFSSTIVSIEKKCKRKQTGIHGQIFALIFLCIRGPKQKKEMNVERHVLANRLAWSPDLTWPPSPLPPLHHPFLLPLIELYCLNCDVPSMIKNRISFLLEIIYKIESTT